MAGFSSSSTLTKLALVGLLLGILLFIIGFATRYWVVYRGYIPHGLWTLLLYPAFWQAVQAMECIGLILGIISLILLILYLFVSNFQGNKNIVLYSLIAAIAAGIFIIIGIIIWGTHFHSSQLGWSFALACVGGVFIFLAGLLLLPERKPGMI